MKDNIVIHEFELEYRSNIDLFLYNNNNYVYVKYTYLFYDQYKCESIPDTKYIIIDINNNRIYDHESIFNNDINSESVEKIKYYENFESIKDEQLNDSIFSGTFTFFNTLTCGNHVYNLQIDLKDMFIIVN